MSTCGASRSDWTSVNQARIEKTYPPSGTGKDDHNISLTDEHQVFYLHSDGGSFLTH